MRSSTESNHAEKRVQVHRDSIYVHDSIFMQVRHDTVYMERWHTRWCESEVLRTDTIRDVEVKKETIQVRYVPAFYKGCAVAVVLAALLLLVKIALYIKKNYL